MSAQPAASIQGTWLATQPIWLQWIELPGADGRKPRKFPLYSGRNAAPRGKRASMFAFPGTKAEQRAAYDAPENEIVLDSVEDRGRLTTFALLEMQERAKPGYALGPLPSGHLLCGVDLDNCFDIDGHLKDEWKPFCKAARDAGAMIERSINRTGLHVVWPSLPEHAPATRKDTVEVYSGGRYFAWGSEIIAPGTGDVLDMREVLALLPAPRVREKLEPQRTEQGKIVPPGGRNNFLREHLEQLVRAGIARATIEQALLDKNEELAEPMDEERIRSTIFKGIDKILIQPHTVPSQVFGPVEVLDAEDWLQPTQARLGEQPAPVVWAWEGWLQQGKVGLLAADGATGKTTMLAHMGICCVTGREFMGRPMKQGPFVLLSRDDDQDDLDAVVQELVLAMGLNSEEKVLVARDLYCKSLRADRGFILIHSEDGGRTYHPSPFVKRLKAKVEQLKPVIVAIDTIRQFTGVESTNEAGQTLFMDICAQVATLGPSVINAHHVGKQASRDKNVDMYSALGTSALSDNARFMWRLLRIEAKEIEAGEVKLPFDAVLPADSELMQLVSTRGSLRVKRPDDIFYTRQGFALDHLAGKVNKLTGDALKAERQRRKEEKQAEAVAAGRAEKLAHLVECFKALGIVGRPRAAEFFKARKWAVIDSNQWSDLKAEAEVFL